MKPSILTSDMERCYICGGRSECVHHIFPGTARRKISDNNGFIVPLCHKCHNMSDKSVHFDKELKLMVMRDCQKAYESQGHTTEDFINLIGRNYL